MPQNVYQLWRLWKIRHQISRDYISTSNGHRWACGSLYLGRYKSESTASWVASRVLAICCKTLVRHAGCCTGRDWKRHKRRFRNDVRRGLWHQQGRWPDRPQFLCDAGRLARMGWLPESHLSYVRSSSIPVNHQRWIDPRRVPSQDGAGAQFLQQYAALESRNEEVAGNASREAHRLGVWRRAADAIRHQALCHRRGNFVTRVGDQHCPDQCLRYAERGVRIYQQGAKSARLTRITADKLSPKGNANLCCVLLSALSCANAAKVHWHVVLVLE